MKIKNINRDVLKGEGILVLVSLLWGSSFLFQKKGMDFVGPFTLGAFRFTIGALILLPIVMIYSKKKSKDDASKNKVMDEKYRKNKTKNQNIELLKAGIECGLAMFFAATLEQIGLIYTTSGKAGFITSMEIIVVAVITVFITKRLEINTALGIMTAMMGLYMLCINGKMTFQYGDSVVLFSCIFWGAQIMLVDKYSKKVDGIKLSFIEFIVSGLISCVCMVLFETPHISDIKACMIPILYTGVIEIAFCYTLQVIGQKYVPPVVSAVTLTLESVFAVFFGAVFMDEILSFRELAGCMLMLSSVIIVQIPVSKRHSLIFHRL